MLRSLFLLLLLPFAIAENEYCSGNLFKPTEANCAKFEFSKLKDDGQCTDSSKATNGTFHGIKLQNCTTFYDISDLPNQSMDPEAVKMAELITNVFENGNTVMGYAAAERLGDCRGYTCGYIGFTTGTNDAYAVVKEYIKRQPKASIGRYLPALQDLTKYDFGDPKRDDTSHLKGFVKAWKKTTCHDPVFIQTQLDMGHSMYLQPALKYAASVGIHSNLGKAIFYDTIVQHGWQYVEKYINLPRVLELTGPKRKGETEAAYMTRFLTTRRQLACCYPGKAWNDSADRMQDLQSIVDDWSQHENLTQPITLKIYGAKITGKEDITMDTERCKKQKKKPHNPPQSIPLPIPDKCPS